MQKRVLKELSQKEQEIIKLSDNVRTLREEKALVGDKLNYAEKQIVLCMNRIKDLDFKVDELSDELEVSQMETFVTNQTFFNKNCAFCKIFTAKEWPN